MAPVRTLDRFAFLMVVLGLLMLTLLVVYFFLHRDQPLEQMRVVETLELGRRLATHGRFVAEDGKVHPASGSALRVCRTKSLE